ncbi:hypothetical protein CROQUDRAFT_109826 [Cronartium quercuum f. sp. fusiforme G11]|uniref:Uncharacterized protein n=1 Tax=Cronartium quercuum f. sp. fusiforme G11 TaxID=708437 RepID=A0A9P6T8E7_9BASI|nr:hypothetical protein CROQUDRAFT_109826 [Cronartium quercuum f. sp. fusiforme G11]
MSSLTLNDLLKKAPPHTNPFAFALERLTQTDDPVGPLYPFAVLIFFAVVYGLLISCCCVIIVWPYFQGPASWERHVWILKRHYSDRSSTPYYILNNALVLTITQVITSVIFEIYIAFLYKSYKSARFGKDVNGFAWADIRWLPGYYGYFIQAWTAFYTWQSQSSTKPKTLKSRSQGLHPWCFNVVLLAVPIIVTAVSISMISLESIAASRQISSTEKLYSALGSLSSNWNSGRQITLAEQNLTEKYFQNYSSDGRLALQRARETNIFWGVSGIPTLVFYAISVWSLLKVVRNVVNEVSRASSTEFAMVSSETDSAVVLSEDLPFGSSVDDESSRSMKRNYTFLAWHYSFMALTLLYDSAVGVFFSAQGSAEIRKATTRSITTLASLGGSVLMLIAMIILMFHTMCEVNDSSPLGKERFTVNDSNLDHHRRDSLYKYPC